MRSTVAIFAPVAVCASLLCPFSPAARAERPAANRRQTQQRPAVETKHTTIGDVKLYGYTRTDLKGDFSSVTVSGPNTTIEVPLTGSGSLVKIHADEINVTGGNKPAAIHAELHGHLRYTVTQQTPEGARELTGTAGQATFRREAHQLELSNGVDCTLSDPALDGPATLQSGSVRVNTANSPYLYTLAGNSETNDVRFTPRPRAGKQNASDQLGPVHITHWENGQFQTGKIANFNGTLVIADLRSRSGTPQGQLKGRHIHADFSPTGEIARAQATDDVHYRIERAVTGAAPDGSGRTEEGRQQVTGTASEATYEPGVGRFTIDGDVDATLVSTLTLASPARLAAARLVVIDPAPGGNSKAMRFELTGSPNHRRLAFTPRERPGTAAATGSPLKPTFALGSIVLTGFQTAVWEPGRQVDVVSDGKQALLLDTADESTHSATHLETHRFKASLAQTGGVTAAETEGPVTFHVQQPAAPRSNGSADGAPARPVGSRTQALDGNAAKAIYTGAGDSRMLALQGPFRAKVTDPEHLAAPGTISGKSDDTLSLDLQTRDYVFKSPNESIIFEFIPRSIESEPAKPVPLARPAAKKK